MKGEGGQLPRAPFDIEQSSIHRRSNTSRISIGTASTKPVQRKLNLSEESAKILGYQESGNKAVRNFQGGDTGKKEDRQGSSGQNKLAQNTSGVNRPIKRKQSKKKDIKIKTSSMEPYLDFTQEINRIKDRNSRDDFAAASKRLNTDQGYVPPSYCD